MLKQISNYFESFFAKIPARIQEAIRCSAISFIDVRVSLLRKTKRNYFKNVKIQDITDNKKFWKTIRPYFSDKGYNQTKITIVEKDSIITDEKK